MKRDLNAILPAELGDHLRVRVSDPQQSYASFREFVVYKCAQLLLHRKQLPVNALGEPNEQGEAKDNDDPRPDNVEQLDEWYLNALNKIQGKGFRGRKGCSKGKQARGVSTARVN